MPKLSSSCVRTACMAGRTVCRGVFTDGNGCDGRRQVEAEERAELLARRSTGGPLGWQRTGVDEEAALKGHVNNSKRILEEAYQTGTAVLGNVAGQRERLKVSGSMVAVTLWQAVFPHALLPQPLNSRLRLQKHVTMQRCNLIALRMAGCPAKDAGRAQHRGTV